MSKVLTIQRSKWRRGGGSDETHGETRLLNDKGLMCCLGFDALACGIGPDKIRGLVSPSYAAACAEDINSPLPKAYVATRTMRGGGNAPAVIAAMDHNDYSEFDEPTREALIRKDLIALGWDYVEFVD